MFGTLGKLIGRFVQGQTRVGPFIVSVEGTAVNLSSYTSVELLVRDKDGATVDTTDKVVADEDQTTHTGYLYWTPAADDVSWELSPYYVHVKLTKDSDPPLFFPAGPADMIEVDRP